MNGCHNSAWCHEHGKLTRSEVTKGYEYEKGKYITIEQQDLEKIKLESTRTIELIQFVDQSELDPVYLDAAYYVAPDNPVSQEAFHVVREPNEICIGKRSVNTTLGVTQK